MDRLKAWALVREWHWSLWGHPYHYTTSLVCKLIVDCATVWWGVRVLLEPDSMSGTGFSYYAYMLEFLPPRVWGAAAVVLAIFGIFRLVAKSKPMWIGGVGYCLLAGFWAYLGVAINLLVPSPVPPGGAAAIGMVGVVAFCALVTSARKPAPGPYANQST